MLLDVIVPPFVFLAGAILVIFYATHSSFFLSNVEIQGNALKDTILLLTIPKSQFDFYQTFFPLYPSIAYFHCEKVINNKCVTLVITLKQGSSIYQVKLDNFNKAYCIIKNGNLECNKDLICYGTINLYLNLGKIILSGCKG